MLKCDENYSYYIRYRYRKELEGHAPIMRSACFFDYALNDLLFDVTSKDLIFGRFGYDELPNIPEQIEYEHEYKKGEAENQISSFAYDIGGDSYVPKSHTCVDYERIVRFGLFSYEEKLNKELQKSPGDQLLQAMKMTLSSIRKFSQRLSKYVSDNLPECENSKALSELLLRVPYEPAKNLQEALQSIWLIHFMVPLAESGWYSISLGRIDHYLYPYYKDELERGKTKDQIRELFRQFYLLLNSYCDAACLVNVGSDYNDLSVLLIELQRDHGFPSPILAARINENTPAEIWNLLIDNRLFSRGQPTFYSETGCRKALLEKGLPEEVAATYSNTSCMGIGIPGKESNAMWGVVLNVSAVLEMALNEGRLLDGRNYFPEVRIKEPTCLNELMSNIDFFLGLIMHRCADGYRLKAKIADEYDPDAFLSLLTDGCIASHKACIGGALYHNVTVECMGCMNVADGICAINELVFKLHRYTLKQINEAVAGNYCDDCDLLSEVRSCPKYGQDGAADEYAVDLMELLQRAIRKESAGNTYFQPSLHTLDLNVLYGTRWGAGYDGRLAGEPYAKNAGPANRVRTFGPTSVMKSAMKLPQMKFYGGQPIDLHFAPDIVQTHKKEIEALISTYLNRGGLQVQVNALSSELLRSAIENPSDYEQLVVRIGGYSVRFNALDRKTKIEFVERFEAEEGKLKTSKEPVK